VSTKLKFDHHASLRIHPDRRYFYVTTQFTAGISTLGWLLVDDETATQVEIPWLWYREIRNIREGPIQVSLDCEEIPLWVTLSLGQHSVTVTALLLEEWG
jgi:hypothetical protein